MSETTEAMRLKNPRSVLYPQALSKRSGEETVASSTVSSDEQSVMNLTDIQFTSEIFEHLHLDDEASRHSRNPSSNENLELDEVLEAYYDEKYCASRRKSIHDRLYQEGQVQAMKKTLAAQRKKEADLNVETPKLNLSTRSYTPLRRRAEDGEKAHERLYKMGIQKRKQAIVDEAKIEAYHLKHSPKPKQRDSSKVVSRLYGKSQTYQQEGKKIRQQIAEKLKSKGPTQTRSISVSRAQAIYNRGLQFKAEREKKIEAMANAPHKSSFPKMRTQTPNRRERFFEAREDDSSYTSARSRSSSVNRARSSSVSRNSMAHRSTSGIRSTSRSSGSRDTGRSLTPSRSRERSQTPSRRISSNSVSTPGTSTTPRLPRSFKLKREFSR